MIIVPKEKPVIENLNSYYVDMWRMFEHFQKEISAGAVHCKSRLAEGVVFFDRDEVLSGSYEDKSTKLEGQSAVDRLTKDARSDSFAINVYEIDPEMIYFWANIPFAEVMYKDLSTEFTDLEALIAKMGDQQLTGYIDVAGASDKESGILFMHNGEIIGGSYAWGEGELNRSEESQKLLIRKTQDSGGVFNVSKIRFRSRPEAPLEKVSQAAPEPEVATDVITMLEELLVTLEKLVSSNKKIKKDFNSLLKKKFVEKADEVDEYVFLDPFAAEFEYFDNRISFVGNAADKDLVNGVVICARELSEELGLLSQLREAVAPWSEKYAADLKRLGASI
ncbi:MAG: hypothetical protein ACLFOY_01730 [Desulfatibacillaceae bacterium]